MPVTFISSSGGGYVVPAGTVILWDPAVTAPSGVFSSYTAYSGYSYIAAGTDNVSTGGTSTHTHTTSLVSVGSAGGHEHTVTSSLTASGTSLGYTDSVYQRTVLGNHSHSASNPTTAGEGAHTDHAISSSTSGTANNNPVYRNLSMYTTSSGGELPDKAILMWYGSSNPLPNSFKICDGTNGTPDMRNMFLGYGTSSGTGGSNASHTHAMGALDGGGSHSHTCYISTTSAGGSTSGTAGYDGGLGSHQHSSSKFGIKSTSTSSPSTHTHPNATSGGGTSLPPYLALYFIQYQKS